jgi:membrane associated rhomboid family serine protease
MKISFNSPVILVFTAICVIFFCIDEYLVFNFNSYIALGPHFDYKIHTYVTAVLGHEGLNHIIGNLTFILLLGPLLEWKYGSKKLITLMLITAVVTGLLNKLFFNTGLIGASGIVFLLIILSSFANYEKGKIPLTFVLVFVLFVGKEVIASYETDNVSQFAHIIGGVVGGIAGFILSRKQLQEV